jgi:hypothetical protein
MIDEVVLRWLFFDGDAATVHYWRKGEILCPAKCSGA